MKRAVGRFLDMVFPRHCISCGRINPGGKFRYLCEACAAGPFAFRMPRCRKCAEIVASEIHTASCARCETEDFHFSEALVACEYAAAGRELVIELKYRRGVWVAKDIAELVSLSRGFEEYFRDSVLVPVPVSSKRRRGRGYNQSEVIARVVAKSFRGLNLRFANLLKRRKHTGTQTALTRDERARNVKGAFEFSDRKVPASSRIIIFDDVITSGATLNECSRVLRRAGYNDIRVFAFARRS